MLKIWRSLEEMKFAEPGRPKLGRHRSPVSRHSIQSYILTYYRLRKRERLIALGSHQGALNVGISGIAPRDAVGLEGVAQVLVTALDSRSKDPRFEPRQEGEQEKTTVTGFFESKMWC